MSTELIFTFKHVGPLIIICKIRYYYALQASSNQVPGSPGLPVELGGGGATTSVAARARWATSSNASVITTLCAVHPFIRENNTLLLAYY